MDGDILLVIAAVLSILVVISLVGNVILVVTIYRAAVLHKPVFVFTANIACADILTTSVNLPYTIVSLVLRPGSRCIFSSAFCTFQTHVSYATQCTVLCFVTITAVYRMTQICYKSTFTRISRIMWLLHFSVLAWTVPVVINALLSGDAKYNPLRYGCYFSTNPLLLVLAGVLFFPMITIFSLSYIKVLFFVYKSTRKNKVRVQIGDEQIPAERYSPPVYKPVIVIFFIVVVMYIVPGICYQLAHGSGHAYKPILEFSGCLLTKMRPVLNLTAILVTSTNLRNAIWKIDWFRCARDQ